MKTVYTAKVRVPIKGMSVYTEKSFMFATPEARTEFLVGAQAAGYLHCGYGLDHVMTAKEALAECRRDHVYIEDTYLRPVAAN